MLNVETEFPNVYSKALQIVDHQPVAVKIIQNLGGRGSRRQLQVSEIGRDGSSAVRRVTLGQLISAAPLSEDEQADLIRLERELAGKAKPRKADLARHEALRHRYNHQRAEQREREEAERRANYPHLRRFG